MPREKNIGPYLRGSITGGVKMRIKKLECSVGRLSPNDRIKMFPIIEAYRSLLPQLERASKNVYQGPQEERRKAMKNFSELHEKSERIWRTLGRKNQKIIDKIYYKRLRTAIRVGSMMTGGFPGT